MEGKVISTRVHLVIDCPCCGTTTTVVMPKTAYNKWQEHEPIQNAWPEGSVTERETLISGLCSACQVEVFQEDDNE